MRRDAVRGNAARPLLLLLRGDAMRCEAMPCVAMRCNPIRCGVMRCGAMQRGCCCRCCCGCAEMLGLLVLMSSRCKCCGEGRMRRERVLASDAGEATASLPAAA